MPVERVASERKRGALELFAGMDRRYDFAGRPAQLRTGSAVAAGDGPGGGRQSRGPGSRRRDRHRAGRAALGRRNTAARWSGSTRAPRCSSGARRSLAGRPELASRIELIAGRGRAAAVRRPGVRPPDLHLSAALRRRPGGDARRAGASGEAGRADRIAGVRPARPAGVAVPLEALHPRRAARPGTSVSAATGTRSAASSDRASSRSMSAGRSRSRPSSGRGRGSRGSPSAA